MNKKVIVTGGYGFIGSNLVDTLINDGIEVVVIDNLSTGNINHHNEKANYLIKDIRDDFANHMDELKDSDAIIHLAGLARIQPSFENPTEFLSVNTQGTANMCDLARKLNCKFVYAGSSSFYGVLTIVLTRLLSGRAKKLQECMLNYLIYLHLWLDFLMFLVQNIQLRVLMQLWLVFFKDNIKTMNQ